MSDKAHLAARAAQDLNSYQAKQGLGPKSDSSTLTPGQQTPFEPPSNTH